MSTAMTPTRLLELFEQQYLNYDIDHFKTEGTLESCRDSLELVWTRFFADATPEATRLLENTPLKFWQENAALWVTTLHIELQYFERLWEIGGENDETGQTEFVILNMNSNYLDFLKEVSAILSEGYGKTYEF
jgi:hypothetical protein